MVINGKNQEEISPSGWVTQALAPPRGPLLGSAVYTRALQRLAGIWRTASTLVPAPQLLAAHPARCLFAQEPLLSIHMWWRWLEKIKRMIRRGWGGVKTREMLRVMYFVFVIQENVKQEEVWNVRKDVSSTFKTDSSSFCVWSSLSVELFATAPPPQMNQAI